MDTLRKVPRVEGWARLDTAAAERRVLDDNDASAHWKPCTTRTHQAVADVLSRFAAVGVHRNVAHGAAGSGTVRALLHHDSTTLVCIAARKVQHATFSGSVRFAHDDTLVDVRLVQLVRDIAHLLVAGAIRGQQPVGPVNVHPSTVVLFHHVGHMKDVPLGVLLGLYVWAHAEIKHPDELAQRGVTAKPWHAAVANGVSAAWDLVHRCPWHNDAGMSDTVLSVLAALPRAMLLQKEAGFDEHVWDRLMQEGLCSTVHPLRLAHSGLHSVPCLLHCVRSEDRW